MKKVGLTSTLIEFLIYLVILIAAVIGSLSVLFRAAYDMVPDWKGIFQQCIAKEQTISDVVRELTEGDVGVRAKINNDASDLIGQGSYKELPVPCAVAASTLTKENTVMNLFDDNLSTNWQEGAAGYGIGQDVRISFDKVYKVKYIAFDLGNRTSDVSYAENGRPSVLTLQIGDFHQVVRFRDVRETQWVELSRPIASDSMRILINDVFEGSKYTDTCISDIRVYGKWLLPLH